MIMEFDVILLYLYLNHKSLFIKGKPLYVSDRFINWS